MRQIIREERQTTSDHRRNRELFTGTERCWNKVQVRSTTERKEKGKNTNRQDERHGTGKEQRVHACVCMQKCVFVCVSRVECGLHGWAIPVQSAAWPWVSVVGGPTEVFDHYRVWQKSSDREVTLSTWHTLTHTHTHHTGNNPTMNTDVSPSRETTAGAEGSPGKFLCHNSIATIINDKKARFNHVFYSSR